MVIKDDKVLLFTKFNDVVHCVFVICKLIKIVIHSDWPQNFNSINYLTTASHNAICNHKQR